MAEAAAPREGALSARTSGLAIAAAIVAFGFIGSRLLGVLRTVAIADAFGASPQLDAYNVAFRVPDLIFQVLAGATLGSAFIPVFARLYRREGEEPAWKLASTVLNLITAATAALCVIAFILAPLLVPLLAPGLGKDIGRHAELTAKAVTLTRLMLLSTMLFAVSGMVTGILNGRQRFFLPALAPMLYNLSIIVGAVFLSKPWGVNGLAAGVVIGAGLHLCVQLPGLWREGMRWQRTFDWHNPATREVGRLMGPRVIGLAAAQVNFLITTFFASKIGASSISDLTYAWLLAGLPLALFGMSLSTAAFPRLAEHVADGDFETFRATVSRVLRVIMFLTVPAALGLALLRVPATTLLLEHGKFNPTDTTITAAALGFYCLGIIPQAGIEIHSRGFYALGDTRTPVILAVLAVCLNLVLSSFLWHRYDEQGLAFSVSISSWFEWSLLYTFYSRRTATNPSYDLSTMSRFAICGALMAFVLAVAFAPFGHDGRLVNAVIALAGSIAGAAIYLGLAHWLGIEELGDAVARFSVLVGRIPGPSLASLPLEDDGLSDHPTDQLIREIAHTGRPPTHDEVERIRFRVANARFDGRSLPVLARDRGLIHLGRALSEGEANTFYVAARRAAGDLQWRPGTTSNELAADLRRAAMHPLSRIGLYVRRGEVFAVAVAPTSGSVMAQRLGPAACPTTVVLYSAGDGALLTGYQAPSLDDAGFPEDVQWLKS